MDDRELMQMALEELEELADVGYGSKTVLQALRERLAQPKQEPVDWQGVAADQAMTIAMMTLESKREWVDIQYVSQHDSPVEYNIAEAVAWAVGYNQALDEVMEKNS
jgi:hypothetical protein